MALLSALLAVLAAGGIVYCALVVVAVRRFLRPPRRAPEHLPAISVLKPLAGLEPGLEANLRSFFEIDYPRYELLFAVRDANDPALAVVQRLAAQYPTAAVTPVVTGAPPSIEEFPNAKVYSLLKMAARARHDLLVISDSDIRAGRDYLRGIAADFADPEVGVTTCPYRAVPAGGPWSLLEALGMNTEFWAGVVVAWLLGQMDFAVGPTMAIRRECLDALGGFERVRSHLAEDFVLGRFAAQAGYRAVLSRHVVEHHIGSQPLGKNLRHRLRWCRSTRRSRPAGYLGQVFTYPLPFALLLAAVQAGSSWPLALLALGATVRFAAAAAAGHFLLRDPLTRRYGWLLPAQDALSLAVWALAFFGDTIEWRGRRYRLLRDGRLQPL